MEASVAVFFLGEATESEKSMMYRTSLRQKMHGTGDTPFFLFRFFDFCFGTPRCGCRTLRQFSQGVLL